MDKCSLRDREFLSVVVSNMHDVCVGDVGRAGGVRDVGQVGWEAGHG